MNLPLAHPEPWIFVQPSTGREVAVFCCRWVDAREQAPQSFAIRYSVEAPGDLVLIGNPTNPDELGFCRCEAEIIGMADRRAVAVPRKRPERKSEPRVVQIEQARQKRSRTPRPFRGPA